MGIKSIRFLEHEENSSILLYSFYQLNIDKLDRQRIQSIKLDPYDLL